VHLSTVCRVRLSACAYGRCSRQQQFFDRYRTSGAACCSHLEQKSHPQSYHLAQQPPPIGHVIFEPSLQVLTKSNLGGHNWLHWGGRRVRHRTVDPPAKTSCCVTQGGAVREPRPAACPATGVPMKSGGVRQPHRERRRRTDGADDVRGCGASGRGVRRQKPVTGRVGRPGRRCDGQMIRPPPAPRTTDCFPASTPYLWRRAPCPSNARCSLPAFPSAAVLLPLMDLAPERDAAVVAVLLDCSVPPPTVAVGLTGRSSVRFRISTCCQICLDSLAILYPLTPLQPESSARPRRREHSRRGHRRGGRGLHTGACTVPRELQQHRWHGAHAQHVGGAACRESDRGDAAVGQAVRAGSGARTQETRVHHWHASAARAVPVVECRP